MVFKKDNSYGMCLVSILKKMMVYLSVCPSILKNFTILMVIGFYISALTFGGMVHSTMKMTAIQKTILVFSVKKVPPIQTNCFHLYFAEFLSK